MAREPLGWTIRSGVPAGGWKSLGFLRGLTFRGVFMMHVAAPNQFGVGDKNTKGEGDLDEGGTNG